MQGNPNLFLENEAQLSTIIDWFRKQDANWNGAFETKKFVMQNKKFE
jgi:hypothetical protein